MLLQTTSDWVKHISRRLLEAVSSWSRGVRVARAPILVAAASACILAIPPQSREIYQALAEDISGNAWHIFVGLALLPTACIALWAMARELLKELPRRSIGPRMPRLLAAACALAIPTGLAIGLYAAASDIQIGQIPDDRLVSMPEVTEIQDSLQRSRAVLLGLAGMISLLAVICGVRTPFQSTKWRRWAIRLGIRQFAVVGLICLVVFVLAPLRPAQLLGPIAIFLLAAVSVASFASALTRWGDRRQVPAFLFVAMGAVLLSILDLSDNHQVELTSNNAAPLNRARDDFRKWYDARLDKAFFEDQGVRYPVFIVAASGGGQYAAQHAATVLSRIQDRCPNFAQHIFAISGVSGGSLGAAVFSGLAKHHAVNGPHVACASGQVEPGRRLFEAEINRFLDTDFLSPLLAASLFPDMVQRFLPAVTPRFDRAKAFEESLIDAWLKVEPTDAANDFSSPFLDHWRPDGVAPALILNTTSVEYGNRVVISPFRIIDMGELGNLVEVSNLQELHELTRVASGTDRKETVKDVSLATAVSLSARFPWILPAGRVELDTGSVRLVDGGYFENSGTETVVDLLNQLSVYYNDGPAVYPKVEFHILIIANLQFKRRDVAPGGLGEILSPIRAMLGTRERRAVVAQSHLFTLLEHCDIYQECGKRLSAGGFVLNAFDFQLPLGWLLSPSTRAIVGLHSGTATRAGTFLGTNPDDQEMFERLGFFVATADSAACTVEAKLMANEKAKCD